MAGQRYTPVEMLARLVAFDTESEKSNLPLVAFVAAYLDGWGVPHLCVPNTAGDKAALFATIGPRERGGILLSGHTDVVPVTGQAWSSDPFVLRVEGGRAYGRGAVDMKGFCALALALVPDMLAADLATPIHLLLSYDEETTCLGVVDTIARFGADLPLPRAAIVGEPTDLEVADAHKSVTTFVTRVHGHPAHSSRPELGANAVMAAADLMHALNLMADGLVAAGDPSGRFDPPYSSLSIGTVAGGTARNILAERCAFDWELRGLPGLDIAAFLARFEEVARRVATERLNRHGAFGRIETEMDISVPGLAPQPGSEAEMLALRIAGRNRTVTAPFGSEAGRFQAAGVPTVVCGPGSIDRAHQPDEYIALDELAAGEAFLRRLIATCR